LVQYGIYIRMGEENNIQRCTQSVGVDRTKESENTHRENVEKERIASNDVFSCLGT
jgi:hypothetical protein